jgi:hypothetical protein
MPRRRIARHPRRRAGGAVGDRVQPVAVHRQAGQVDRKQRLLVRGVIAASICSRSMLRVTGSMSTSTGVAPTSRITLAVATQVSGVLITSSPGPTPARRSATSSVAVPELKARTGRPPQIAESAASKACTFGPLVIQPERSTSQTAAMVSSSIDGRVIGSMGSFGGVIGIEVLMSWPPGSPR